MKNLNTIIQSFETLETIGDTDVNISYISIDSRDMQDGGLYIAIPGDTVDGHTYINGAIENGAIAVVCQNIPEKKDDSVTYISTVDTRVATGHIASAFYGNPSAEITLVGITGTNGKTTTAILTYQLLQLLSKSSAVLSTAGDFFNGNEFLVHRAAPTSLEIIEFNRVLRQLVDEGCEYCTFEVSSHALDQHRIAGLNMDVGAYTNLSQDHLDYHKTMENYATAKKKLFDLLPAGAHAIMNTDDDYAEFMSRDTKATIHPYGMNQVTDVLYTTGGVDLTIDNHNYHLPLLGKFNVYNTLAAIESLAAIGFDKKEILKHIKNLQPIAGRAEIAQHPSGITGVIDYAHTADGLENILTALRDVMTDKQRLITVVGCGGDRDTTKRKPMAEMAMRYSDYSIFTSDNPRGENPEDIITMMSEKLEPSEKWTRVTSRADAIAHAIEYATPDDVILIAGKGHETYQEIQGVKHPFSDSDIFLNLS